MGTVDVDILVRWLHIVGVIVWMGHNWSNVVHTPRYRRILPADPPEATRAVFTAASKREHGLFRHASLLVWGTGVLMLLHRGELLDALALSGPMAVVGLGAWTGTLMVLNLWFVMWPHQKKVLGFVPAPVEERLRCTRVTFLASRANSVLSVPTLACMVAGAHGVPLFW